MWAKPSSPKAASSDDNNNDINDKKTPGSPPQSPSHIRRDSAAVRNPGRRFAQIVRLKPEHIDEYVKAHAAVWPEVLQQIKACNIQDCEYFSSLLLLEKKEQEEGGGVGFGGKFMLMTFFLFLFSCSVDSISHDEDSGILFASFKYIGYDFAGDMEKMRDNPKVREWWQMTDGWQEVSVFPRFRVFPMSPPPS